MIRQFSWYSVLKQLYSPEKNNLKITKMAVFQEKYFYLCQIPLSSEGPSDVTIITHAVDSVDFPRVFGEYEERRKHALNEDGVYSIIRADELNLIVRTTTKDASKALAFEEATPDLITNLQHRVMQSKDKNAQSILKSVFGIEVNMID